MERRFLLKLFVLAIVVGVVAPWTIQNHLWFVREGKALAFPGRETYAALRNSRRRVEARTIVLGDSVAHQLYDEGAVGGVYSLACNQGVSMVGYYVLLRTLADANDLRGRKVFLVIHPGFLGNELDQPFTFHYFLKPFYEAKAQEHFSDVVRGRIADVPYAWAALLPVVRISTWSPTAAPKWLREGIGPVSLEYLTRMRALARERGFEFEVVSPWISESRSHLDLAEMRSRIHARGLDDVFETYDPLARVLPDAAFIDGVHYVRSVRWDPDPLALGAPEKETGPAASAGPAGLLRTPATSSPSARSSPAR